MMNVIGFFVTIFLANIIQGITGFAGTILALPFCVILMGYDTTRPILNALGILSGVYVFLKNKNEVNWKEVRILCIRMLPGICIGIFLQQYVISAKEIFCAMLGVFIMIIAMQGMISLKREKKQIFKTGVMKTIVNNIVLVFAGVVHGLFVSGGPLVVNYLADKIEQKECFRTTISVIWIILNGIILVRDGMANMWNKELVIQFLGVCPALLLGVYLGGVFQQRISQTAFMKITYVLLFLSGVALL